MNTFLNVLLTSLCVPLLTAPAEPLINLHYISLHYIMLTIWQDMRRTDGRTDGRTEEIGSPPSRGTRTENLASSKPRLIVSFVVMKVKYLECLAVTDK
jgi:hypothetical protein